MTHAPERIEGWKAIAAYLGKSVRTAQQWSVARGLPVRKAGGGVVALRSEIDAWLAGAAFTEAPQPSTPTVSPVSKPAKRTLLFWSTASAAIIALAGASFWATQRSGTPVGFRVRGPFLQTLDARGRVAWERSFPEISQSEYPDEGSRDDWSGQRGLFADLNGDGKRRLLFVYYPRNPSPDNASTLFCFRDDGAVLWSTKLGRTLTTESGLTIYPSYRTNSLAVLKHPRLDGGKIVVSSHHSYEWTEQVAILDAHGRVCSEYWHPGWFARMIIGEFGPGDQEEIALGGVNNGFRAIGFGPTMVLLDPDSANGQATEPDGDLSHRLTGIPPAKEAAVILFPDVIRDPPEHPLAFNYVRDIDFASGFLHASVSGLEHIHYQFDQRLKLGGFAADEATEKWVARGPLLARQAAIKNAVSGIKVLRNRFAAATVGVSIAP
jgi:hypothetical protein